MLSALDLYFTAVLCFFSGVAGNTGPENTRPENAGTNVG